MNDENRDLLERAKAVLETVENLIETVMEEEQDFLDSLPENDALEDVTEKAAAAVEQMEEAVASVGDALDALELVLE